MMYKYFLKAFYNKTNKKKYKLQISLNNVYYTNIIAMKDVINTKKVREKKRFKNIIDIITLAEVTKVLSPINFDRIYV